MLWRFIGFVVAVLLCSLPAQLDAFIVQSMGCHHNGTWYADRSIVPTMEKCLTCQCQKKTLVCRLKVCPEMPMPPPRGCIVVQQRNSCCPYLSCARLEAFYKIPSTRRIIAYLDHYERESIDRVVNDNMLQRRSDDSDVDMYVCVKNGTVYKSGSAMSSSNLCTYCYCIGGTEKCVKPKCMLPVEGCKPIFVDATCCPVRYDCTSKPAGKSSQEVRYRKTANKHYLRMSQRLQRNRGCTVNRQFYVEGQKMPSDPDKPCDICFCIRGARRCAPKKCSPALKNCIPVVPKGQCCPSSYDCGSQRAQSSRQFNLFSLLFGKEDELNGNDTKRLPAVEYPPDRHPSVTVTHQQNILQKNDEKSILDTIREGLEIIDGNNDEMIAENMADKLVVASAPLTKVVTEGGEDDDVSSTQPMAVDSASTEVSFLDLLLGNDEEDGEMSTKVTEDSLPELKTTTAYEGLSWVDILLGPDEEDKKLAGTTTGDAIGLADTTTSYQNESSPTSIDRIDHDFGGDFSGSGEIVVGETQTNESVENLRGNLTGLNNEVVDRRTQAAYGEKEASLNWEHKPNKANEAAKEGGNSVDDTTADTTKPLSTQIPEITDHKRKVSTTTTKPITIKTTTRKATTTSEKPITTTKTKPTTTITTTRPTITTTKSTIIRTKSTTTTKPAPKMPTAKLPTKPSATNDPLVPGSSTSTPKTTQKPIELKFLPKTTYKPKEKLSKTTTARPLNLTQAQTTMKGPPQQTTKTPVEKKKNGLLTALLDGLSDMLSGENVFNGTQKRVPPKMNSSTTTTTRTTTTRKPTEVPNTSPIKKPQKLPSFKPLPIPSKPSHMRINSKIANLTIAPQAMKTNVMLNVTVFKPLPVEGVKMPLLAETTQEPMVVTAIAVNTTESTASTTTAAETKSQAQATTSSATTMETKQASTSSTITTATPPASTMTTTTSTTTIKPIVIETNPTILEADPFDANAQPTLPPSLPNLKIIPFLPTDAVKADRNNLPYDYYHSKSPTAKIDYDQYDEGNMYPAITEPHFPIYPDLEDDNKAEYIYKFKVEGPSPPVMSSSVGGGKLDGMKGATAAAAFVKYDFVGSQVEHKGFSPPTKTEGGFVPKDPLLLGDDDDGEVGVLPPYVDAGYQVTKHIIDITTSEPMRENTTKVIEITTPDPFKNVIRTEPPPDLTSLIEDKENILIQKPIQQQPIAVYEDPEHLSQSLIHITTAEPQSENMVNDALIQHITINKNNADQANAKIPNEEHKNTIASFLDLLLGDDTSDVVVGMPEINVTVGASADSVPPFKSLPQAAVELLPNITSATSTTVMPKIVVATTTRRITANPITKIITQTITTEKPSSTTVKAASTTTLPIGTHKLNATAAAAPGTKFKPKTKTPMLHRNNAASGILTSATTKTQTTTRPKNTRPKLNSTRRQTTIGANNKRWNSTKTTTTVTTTTTTITAPTTTTQRPQPPTTKPLLRSPFDTLPFMDTSFDVKRTTERSFVVGQHSDSDFLGLLHYKTTLNHFEGLEPARESFPNNSNNPTTAPTTTTTTTTTSAPLVQRNIEQIISAADVAPQSLDAIVGSAATTTSLEVQHAASNSLIDPTGVLKLAGCNIYGRMYRVGRIILELSSPCLECKCTEVGVKCGQLDC